MPNADSLVCVRLFGMKIPKGCYIIECAFSSCANDNHFTNFGLNELTVYLYCEKVGEVAEALRGRSSGLEIKLVKAKAW